MIGIPFVTLALFFSFTKPVRERAGMSQEKGKGTETRFPRELGLDGRDNVMASDVERLRVRNQEPSRQNFRWKGPG